MHMSAFVRHETLELHEALRSRSNVDFPVAKRLKMPIIVKQQQALDAIRECTELGNLIE